MIYSDYDPVVVAYAREILGDTPNVHFFEADARRPEDLLNSPEVQAILGDNHSVGLVSWGIGMFLSDEELAHLAQSLYDWAGPGSCWALNAQGADIDSELKSSHRVQACTNGWGRRSIFARWNATRNLSGPGIRTDRMGASSGVAWFRAGGSLVKNARGLR